MADDLFLLDSLPDVPAPLVHLTGRCGVACVPAGGRGNGGRARVHCGGKGERDTARSRWRRPEAAAPPLAPCSGPMGRARGQRDVPRDAGARHGGGGRPQGRAEGGAPGRAGRGAALNAHLRPGRRYHPSLWQPQGGAHAVAHVGCGSLALVGAECAGARAWKRGGKGWERPRPSFPRRHPNALLPPFPTHQTKSNASTPPWPTWTAAWATATTTMIRSLPRSTTASLVLAAASAAGLHRGGLRRVAFSTGDLTALAGPPDESPRPASGGGLAAVPEFGGFGAGLLPPLGAGGARGASLTTALPSKQPAPPRRASGTRAPRAAAAGAARAAAAAAAAEASGGSSSSSGAVAAASGRPPLPPGAAEEAASRPRAPGGRASGSRASGSRASGARASGARPSGGLRRVASAVELTRRGGLSRSSSAADLAAAAALPPPEWAPGARVFELVTPEGRLYPAARVTASDRASKILRYRHKRHERNFTKRIKYACRKTLADARPRVRGRFARSDDKAAVPPKDGVGGSMAGGAAGGAASGLGGPAAAAALPPPPPPVLAPPLPGMQYVTLPSTGAPPMALPLGYQLVALPAEYAHAAAAAAAAAAASGVGASPPPPAFASPPPFPSFPPPTTATGASLPPVSLGGVGSPTAAFVGGGSPQYGGGGGRRHGGRVRERGSEGERERGASDDISTSETSNRND